MSGKRKITPMMVFADKDGNIYDHPELLMLCRRGREMTLPRPDELVPLPEESSLYLLPCRHPVGFDQTTGRIVSEEGLAVAAFVCPGYTLAGQAAYISEENAPELPLFAYGAVGFAENRLWAVAKKVDEDKRQVFTRIDPGRIENGAAKLMRKYPKNRLVRHLGKCALTYCCPAAKNFALGRFEAPLPTSRSCNARCVGCISLQEENSGVPSPQNRIDFTPTVAEIVEVMKEHERRARKPVYSFGQGCEGEPLTESTLIGDAIDVFRSGGGKGTVNINTNASMPDQIERLAKKGLSSIRMSMNSAQCEWYERYHRPKGFSLQTLVETGKEAKKNGLFVSLNYFFVPGVSDSEMELEAMFSLLGETGADFIQLRNLSMDPERYLEVLQFPERLPCMGLKNFMRRIKKSFPGIGFGYFNPYLENQEN